MNEKKKKSIDSLTMNEKKNHQTTTNKVRVNSIHELPQVLMVVHSLLLWQFCVVHNVCAWWCFSHDCVRFCSKKLLSPCRRSCHVMHNVCAWMRRKQNRLFSCAPIWLALRHRQNHKNAFRSWEKRRKERRDNEFFCTFITWAFIFELLLVCLRTCLLRKVGCCCYFCCCWMNINNIRVWMTYTWQSLLLTSACVRVPFTIIYFTINALFFSHFFMLTVWTRFGC